MSYDSGSGILQQGFTKIGISQGDLEKALHCSNIKSHILLIGDLAADGVTRANRINKWARYKPFQYAGVFENNSAGAAARLAANSNAYFGFVNGNNRGIPTFTNWSTLIAGSPENYATPWTYYPPVTYYRALDFDGYIDNCREWGLDSTDTKHLYSPMGIALYIPGSQIGQQDFITFEFTKGNSITNDKLLYLDDFDTTSLPLNSYYFGLLAVASTNPTSSSAMYISEYKPSDVSADYLSFTIPASLTAGTYSFVPVLCSTKLSTPAWASSIPSSGTVVTIDGYHFDNITIQTNSPNLNVTAEFKSQTSTQTTWTITIGNHTGATIAITDIFMFAEPEYYLDYDFVTHDYIDIETDWESTSKTDAQFKADVQYDNKVVAKYVDIYTTFYAQHNRNTIGNNTNMSFDVTLNAVADENGHPFNNSSILKGWFRYNATKHMF